MDRDQYASAQITDLLLQAEAALKRANAVAYWLRETPEQASARHSEIKGIEASIARYRETI